MNDAIFREYDIRGIVGTDLVIEECFALGQAIDYYFYTQNPTYTTLIIGRDGRSHSQAISNYLIDAFLSHGINVIDIGIVPTPCLYYTTYALNTQQACIVTASHNPKEYNGIKIWNTFGSQIQQIRQFFKQGCKVISRKHRGTLSHYDAKTTYIHFLSNHFSHLKGINANAIIDCGNGSASTIIPQLLEKLNFKNVALSCATLDGSFPNHEADPTVPRNMMCVKNLLAQSVTHTLGIGFDGDADRMNPMTKNGFLVPGDQLLALYAQAIPNKEGRAIIFDIKSSAGLTELLEQWHCTPIMSPSGHSYIKKAIKDYNALLGGELSCHFFFNDRYFGFDDGIYAALRLIELLHYAQISLDALLSVFPPKITSPEYRIPCSSDGAKKTIMRGVQEYFSNKKNVSCVTIDGIRAETKTGWGLARASNTQPVICLRFEAATQQEFLTIKNDFYTALTSYFDEQLLKDTFEL